MRYVAGPLNLLALLVSLVFALSGFSYINEELRRHPVTFLAFWIFLPLVEWWLIIAKRHQREPFTPEMIRKFSTFSLVTVMLISFLVFLNWENIRDAAGKHYVEGYFVTHETELTENGPQRTSTVYAKNWYAERLMWLFEVAMVAGIFGLPVIAFKQRELLSTESATSATAGHK